MPYTFYLYEGIFFHAVDLLIEQVVRLMYGLIEFPASRISPVDEKARLVQRIPQLKLNRIGIRQILHRIEHQHAHVIKVVHFFIKICQIRPVDPVLLFSRHAAALQTGPEAERKTECLTVKLLREEDFLMVHVNSLIRLLVNIAHCLKAGVISCSCISEIKDSDSPLSFPRLRYRDFLVEPQIAVAAAPSVFGMYRVPSFKFCGNLRIHNALSVLARGKFFQCGNFSVTVFSDLSNSSVKFSLC